MIDILPLSYSSEVEEEIKERLNHLGVRGGGLYEPVRYIMSIGGKRIRPMLVAAGYRLFKEDPAETIPAAAAIELFHNFTLVHDDIMDEAPLRRGNPTVHQKWNSSAAILSGDAMLVLVYDWLSEYKELLPGMMRHFNQAALRVCEGQQLDMSFEVKAKVSETDYLEMIRLKTGELLGASLAIGALIGGADEEKRNALHEFGCLQGMAFQMVDDLLDTFGAPSFGKKTGGDILSGKKTWLMIHALTEEPVIVEQIMKYQGEKRIEAMRKLYLDLDLKQRAEQKIATLIESSNQSLESVQGNSVVSKALTEWFAKLAGRSV